MTALTRAAEAIALVQQTLTDAGLDDVVTDLKVTREQEGPTWVSVQMPSAIHATDLADHLGRVTGKPAEVDARDVMTIFGKRVYTVAVYAVLDGWSVELEAIGRDPERSAP